MSQTAVSPHFPDVSQGKEGLRQLLEACRQCYSTSTSSYDLDRLRDIAAAIRELPLRSSSDDNIDTNADVVFITPNGIYETYSAEEVLSDDFSMPALSRSKSYTGNDDFSSPSWNYTKEQLQHIVSDLGGCVVGALYRPSNLAARIVHEVNLEETSGSFGLIVSKRDSNISSNDIDGDDTGNSSTTVDLGDGVGENVGESDYFVIDWGDAGDIVDASVEELTEGSYYYHDYTTSAQYVVSIYNPADTITLSTPMSEVNEDAQFSVKEVVFGKLDFRGTSFKNCMKLEKVFLSNEFTRGDTDSSLFENCLVLNHVSLPNGMWSLEPRMFALCLSLSQVSIPEGIREIGDEAFINCFNLNVVSLPETLTRLGESSFLNCESLKSISIPKEVVNLSAKAFKGCSTLRTVTFSKESKVETVGDECFFGCGRMSILRLPGSVIRVSASSFAECFNLNFITGYGVREVGDYAFSECTSLSSIEFPKLEKIGEYAFSGCKNIDKFTLKRGQDVAATAFSNAGVTSITLPDFSWMSYFTDTAQSTKHIKIDNEEYIGQTDVDYSNDTFTETLDSSVLAGFTLLETVDVNYCKSFGDNSFSGCTALKSVVCNSGLTEIGDSAFSYCSSLTSIESTTDVESVGRRTFLDCSSLQSIELPACLYLGEAAFSGAGLTEISLPSLLTLGSGAFSGCASLKEAELNPDATKWEDHLFDGCTMLKSVAVPNELTEIPDATFRGCASLYDLNLTVSSAFDSNDSNDSNDFDSSSQLPSRLVSIGDEAFSECTKFCYSGELVLPKKLVSVGNKAFYKAGFASVVLPASLTEIGDDAFTCDTIDATACTVPVHISSNAFSTASQNANFRIKIRKEQWHDWIILPEWRKYWQYIHFV